MCATIPAKVGNYIAELDGSRKAPGADSYNATMLKTISNYIVAPLSVYPNKLKHTIITSIYKGGDIMKPKTAHKIKASGL